MGKMAVEERRADASVKIMSSKDVRSSEDGKYWGK